MIKPMKIGFPRMRVEAGERRDYLPEYISRLEKLGAQILLENNYGIGMGFTQDDYRNKAPHVRFVSHEEAYHQDYVFVLRCPDKQDLRRMHPGACLISMLHYPTRPRRTAFLRSLEIEAISLDSLTNDSGARLVENLRAVAWNGIEIAFQQLQVLYPAPGFESTDRSPIKVTLLGSGAVGIHTVQSAIRYGDPELWKKMAHQNIPGVQVTVVDYDTTPFEGFMHKLLAKTDILVDATQRRDPSVPVIPNEWIGVMPKHGILVDLSVDPYDPPEVVKGIEGIPHGNLDQYVFPPNSDTAYEEIPSEINAANRRTAISCYSWPGVHPRACMQVYGEQLAPIFRALIDRGGVDQINPNGGANERAIYRSLLSHWT